MWKWGVTNHPSEAVDVLNRGPIVASELVVGMPFGEQVVLFYFNRPGVFSAEAPVKPDSLSWPDFSGDEGVVPVDPLIASDEDLEYAKDSKRGTVDFGGVTPPRKVWHWNGNTGHPTSPIIAIDMAVDLAKRTASAGAWRGDVLSAAEHASSLNLLVLLNAEIAAREIGELSLPDALAFCLLLADVDPPRFDRAIAPWDSMCAWSVKIARSPPRPIQVSRDHPRHPERTRKCARAWL